MSDKVKELTVDNFKETIASGTVLVDFWAPWCGPCKMQAPILDKVAEQIGDKAVIAKDGKKVQDFIGVQQEPALIEALS